MLRLDVLDLSRHDARGLGMPKWAFKTPIKPAFFECSGRAGFWTGGVLSVQYLTITDALKRAAVIPPPSGEAGEHVAAVGRGGQNN